MRPGERHGVGGAAVSSWGCVGAPGAGVRGESDVTVTGGAVWVTVGVVVTTLGTTVWVTVTGAGWLGWSLGRLPATSRRRSCPSRLAASRSLSGRPATSSTVVRQQ